ncbi:MAG: hypothetical protein GXO42_01420 [bacterium]|nr:hypothetical protein [bacterium]
MKHKVNLTIKVMTTINPTEDAAKVIQAVRNLFPELELRIEDNIVVAEGKGKKHLEKIRNYLWQQRVLDAARQYILKHTFSDMIILKLNKQAALAGKVCFCDTDEESPMGSIQVIVETDNPELVVDWLAPPTSYGKPIKQVELED